MKDIISFLKLIRENNNREWFNDHKNMYLRAKEKFDTIANDLIYEVGKFDDSCSHLTLQDCVFRFYRDTRFSKDKTPYKSHFGVFICPKGKKSMWAGYYFHIEPAGGSYLGNHMLACGTYNPDKEMLQSIREDIVADGEDYLKAVKKAKNFFLLKEPALKMLPKGFQSGKYDDLIKLKSHMLEMHLEETFLTDKNIVKNVARNLATTHDYVALLNNAISFSGNY